MTKEDIMLTTLALTIARNTNVLDEVIRTIIDDHGTEIIQPLLDNDLITFSELIHAFE